MANEISDAYRQLATAATRLADALDSPPVEPPVEPPEPPVEPPEPPVEPPQPPTDTTYGPRIPVGPQPATAPPGAVVAKPGDDLAKKLGSVPAGGVLYLEAGVYPRAVIPSRSNVTVMGSGLGTILDGGGQVAQAVSGNASNFTISNLWLRGYNNRAQTAVIDATNGNYDPQASGWKMLQLRVTDYTGVGLGVGTGGLVRGCEINGTNAQLGVKGGGKGGVIEDCHVHHVNTVGNAQNTGGGNQYQSGGKWFWNPGWEAGGSKMIRSDGLTIRHCEFGHNNGPGIWYDIANKNSVVEANYCHDNDATIATASGIFMELQTSDPATTLVHGNRVENNSQNSHVGWLYDAQILISTSHGCCVYDNHVVTGQANGICVLDQGRGNEFWSNNDVVHDNVVQGAGLSGAQSDRGFDIYSTSGFDSDTFDRAHRFAWGGQSGLDFAAFQRAGQEKNGKVI